MKIVSIHIDGFGNLKNIDYVLSSGMNIKEIGTVWDRSAVAEFVIAMFYGLEGELKLRNMYAPRDGGAFGGSMKFQADGNEYMITRSFGTDDGFDRMSFINYSSGIPVSFEPYFLIGSTREQYVRNATVIEGSSYDDHSIQDRNLLMSVINAEEERFVSHKALEALARAETRLTRGGTRVVEEARYKEEQKLYDLQADLKFCQQKSDEVKVLRDQEAEAENVLNEKKTLMEEAEDKLNDVQSSRKANSQHIISLVLSIVCMSFGVIMILAGVLFRFEIPGSVNGSYDTIYDGFVLMLFALVVFYLRRRWRRGQENKIDSLRKNADDARQEYEDALSVDNEIREQIKTVSKDADRVGAASDMLENFKKRVDGERSQLTVIRGARKYIMAATEEAGQEYVRIKNMFPKEMPVLLVMDVFSDHTMAREVFDRISEKCQVLFLK
ncbi:MAG: hypothetical protein K6G03_00785 [Lachnospiraceae bacterium]|nr:hypothetical protein [Lachnospiraceae bacterium]